MLQYKLRSLFIATAATALVSWAFFAPPQWLGMLALVVVYFVLPAAVIAGTIYHRGNWQAFFVGTIPWATASWLWVVVAFFEDFPELDRFFDRPNDVVVIKFGLAVPLAVMLVSGLAAVGVRAWACRHQRGPE